MKFASTKNLAVLFAAGMSFAGSLLHAEPALVEKHALTLETARMVLDAAIADAQSKGVGGAIAVVDDGGNLITLARLDNTFPAGANVAIGKARTAAIFRKKTGDFETTINNGRFTMTALPDFTPLQGGLPLLHEGHLVGGIGVSGTSSAPQDEEVAQAGAKALAVLPGPSAHVANVETAQPAAAPAKSAATMRILVNIDREGVALQGYDPVAYFTDNKPVKGKDEHRSAWEGATYYFASAEHKAAFEKSPEKYAPQFGGYCGYAASIDRLSPISPEFFQVLDGRLILQHNQKAWDLWSKDIAGNLVKADRNWPGLVERNGVLPSGKVLVNLDDKGVAILGYDPVAYFTDGKPVMGDAQFEAVYNGAKYHFASKEHRETFEKNPSAYVPAYGGFCGYAASINKVSPVNPIFWQIEDGRLILQHTRKAWDLFNEDKVASIRRADANWPGLVERKGRDIAGRKKGFFARIFSVFA